MGLAGAVRGKTVKTTHRSLSGILCEGSVSPDLSTGR
jgi:hypothetical protein